MDNLYKNIQKSKYNKINMPNASVHVLPDEVVLVIDEGNKSLELFVMDQIVMAIIDDVIFTAHHTLIPQYWKVLDKYKGVAWDIYNSDNWHKAIRGIKLKDFRNYCDNNIIGGADFNGH